MKPVSPVTPEKIARGCGKAKRTGDGWMCQCPAHDDKNPSLKVWTDAAGVTTWKCYAGCEHETVRRELETLGLLEVTNNRPYCKDCHDFHEIYYEECHPEAIRTINQLIKENLLLEKQLSESRKHLPEIPDNCTPNVPEHAMARKAKIIKVFGTFKIITGLLILFCTMTLTYSSYPYLPLFMGAFAVFEIAMGVIDLFEKDNT